jgi:hypothetical protein
MTLQPQLLENIVVEVMKLWWDTALNWHRHQKLKDMVM